MLVTILYKYFFITAIFLIHSLLEFESVCKDLKESRVREFKVTLNKKLIRKKKDILLSFVWPARIFTCIRECIDHFKHLRKS